MNFLPRYSAVALVAGVLVAQPPGVNVERRIRASIGGSMGDQGKCTIEVDVDGVADIEVFEDQGRLITLAGQPSEWRRLQCNQPMPANPQDFRFTGQDGRGRVSLQRDPRQNRGVAVVRVEDPKGGREGYTFDLIWRAFGDRPGYVPPPDPVPNYPGRGGDYSDGRRWETILLTCESDGRRRYCGADTSRGALLLRPRGPNECRLGATWGYDQRGIWVDRGCRAEFQVAR